MPQDKRRSSISYRSFVTCDDPKGVECGVIRKSKINNNSQKKEQDCSNKVEADRKQRNQNTSLVVASVIKEERDKKEMGVRGITRAELENPVSFQLLEVSKETEKLNHVINSWSSSSGSSYDKLLRKKQNDSVAKDLLRGALDLQESLVMLGKLQEASSYMLGLSRKQKQKLDEGAFDVMVSGVRGNSRPAMHHVDGYPRKSVDEMRNVVRDSLLRHNMISNPVFEEHCDHRKMSMASPDMLPSTSSSTQSSMVYSSNFVPSDSSVSSSTASRRKNGKDSNLIVRLMGLESFPSSPRKHTEREKLLNLAKPTYEIDSPRAKRPQFGAQEVGLKQRSVEEILERLKFKGLLRNSSVDGLTIHSSESENYSSNNSWVDERPPIVVMKPMRYPCLDLDEPYKTKFWGERDMKPRCSRGSAQEIVRNEAVNYSENNEVARVDCEEKAKSVKKVASAKLKGSVNVKPKPQKKQTEVKKATEVEKVTPTRRKVEEKKDARSSDQLNSRDQARFSTAKITRQKDGKSIPKNQSSNQQNTTSTSMLDQRKRRTSEWKKNRQPALGQEEKRICKGEKKESTVFYKEDIDSASDRTSVCPAVNSFTADNNDNKRCQIQIRDYDFDSQIKLLDTPDQYSCLPNDKNISHYDDNQSSYSEITSVSTSEYCNADQLSETQSTLHEVTLITTHENGIAVHHETNQEGTKSLKISVESTDNKALRPCLTPRMKLKALLLNNSLFVSHIEELFNIQVNPESVPCMIDDNDQDSESAQILIDCANELLELKSSQFLQSCLPLPRIYTTKLQSYFSLDRLLEEVCNGIENLRLYSRPVNDEFPFDDLYVILDRDLEFKSITWEVGWKSMFTLNEVEQVIGEVDKFILGNLIEEVVSDFMLYIV